MPNADPDTPVTILVDPNRFEGTVLALLGAGVRVDEEQPEIGTVSARVAPDGLAALRGIDGVLAVEGERGVQLPPPDSEIQ